MALKIRFIGLFCFFMLMLRAQEQLGLRIENFAGVSGLSLNPTNNFNNPLAWDINIVGFGSHFSNNFAYVKKSNLFTLYKNSSEITFQPTIVADPDRLWASNTQIIDFYDNNKKRFFNLFNYANLPSIALRIGETHSVGLFFNFRSGISTQGVPSDLNYYGLQRRNLGDFFKVQPLQIAGMVWSEIGLNYAQEWTTGSNNKMSVGANLKILNGYEGGIAYSRPNIEIARIYGTDSVRVKNPDIWYAVTTSNFALNDIQFKKNGSGVGLDLGFQYVVASNDSERPYLWRVGASLIDVGSIKFKKNAEVHELKKEGEFELTLQNYKKQDDDLFAYQKQLSYDIYKDSIASKIGDSFSVILPTALSLQADVNIFKNIFANVLLMQRMPINKNLTLKRENLFALTPRYETRWFSASMPIMFYNWNDFRMGLAARLAFLTIGTDYLGSFLGKHNLRGTDFYVALKINPFNIGANFDKGNGGGGKNIKCYQF